MCAPGCEPPITPAVKELLEVARLLAESEFETTPHLSWRRELREYIRSIDKILPVKRPPFYFRDPGWGAPPRWGRRPEQAM